MRETSTSSAGNTDRRRRRGAGTETGPGVCRSTLPPSVGNPRPCSGGGPFRPYAVGGMIRGLWIRSGVG